LLSKGLPRTKQKRSQKGPGSFSKMDLAEKRKKNSGGRGPLQIWEERCVIKNKTSGDQRKTESEKGHRDRYWPKGIILRKKRGLKPAKKVSVLKRKKQK